MDHQTHDALEEYVSQVRPTQSKYLHARPAPSDTKKKNTLELRLKYQELGDGCALDFQKNHRYSGVIT